MIDHVLDRYREVVEAAVIVVHPADRLMATQHLQADTTSIQFAEQAAPTGMLDAILCASDAVKQDRPERVWITWCDQVGISAATVAMLRARDAASPEQDVIFPVVRQTSPYIHFERGPDGRLASVRQRREGDVMPQTGTSDAGLFSLSRKAFEEWLPSYAREAQLGAGTGERNFLPFLPWLSSRGKVMTFEIAVEEAQGINTPEDLSQVERRLGSPAEGRS